MHKGAPFDLNGIPVEENTENVDEGEIIFNKVTNEWEKLLTNPMLVNLFLATN